MIEFECPLSALYSLKAPELAKMFSEPITPEDAALNMFGKNDTWGRVVCSVGVCAVSGSAVHREQPELGFTGDSFELDVTKECVRRVEKPPTFNTQKQGPN